MVRRALHRASAKRVHWTLPGDLLVELVARAAAKQDAQERSAPYLEYEEVMIDQANLIVLFQAST